MGAETARRGATSRCVACGARCDAYFCDWCGVHSQMVAARHADDRRAMTATRVSQHMQRNVERAADLEQLAAIMGANIPSLAEVDDDESKRIRSLVFNNHLPQFSPAELAQWEDKLEQLGALWITRHGTELRLKSREHVHQRRYQRFCEMWSKLGLGAITSTITDAVKPRRRRPRVCDETISKIESKEHHDDQASV